MKTKKSIFSRVKQSSRHRANCQITHEKYIASLANQNFKELRWVIEVSSAPRHEDCILHPQSKWLQSKRHRENYRHELGDLYLKP